MKNANVNEVQILGKLTNANRMQIQGKWQNRGIVQYGGDICSDLMGVAPAPMIWQDTNNKPVLFWKLEKTN